MRREALAPWCAPLLALGPAAAAHGQSLMTTPIGFRSGFTEGAVTARALHCNLGIARETSAGEAFSRGFGSVWLSRRLAGPFGVYGEAYGSTRERPGGEWTRYVHGGLTVLILPWIHADLHGGVGSRSAGSPRWIGLGVRQRV